MANLIRTAYWLEKNEQDPILQALKFQLFQSLDEEHQRKLLLILLSLLYAEKLLKSEGKSITLLMEKVFRGQTLGMWNFHVMHADHFGYSKKAFRKVLLDRERSTEIVITFLIHSIGLKKDPAFIFAEYNHNLLATSVTALQQVLNRFIAPDKIVEDGLIGKETKRAIKKCEALLPDFFQIDTIDEEMLLKTLSHFNVNPTVPMVYIKKDLRFLGVILKRSLKDIRHLRRFVSIFERDINIPKYVDDGLFAFNYLQREKV